MSNQFKASSYHRNYIEEVNKQMEKQFELTLTELYPYLKLLPPVILKYALSGFYDIESEESSNDKIRVSKLTQDAKKRLQSVFNIDFDNCEGFSVLDNFYRYGTSYLIAFHKSKLVILGLRESEGGGVPACVYEEDKIISNTIEDVEGLLWLICALIDVFFNLEPSYH